MALPKLDQPVFTLTLPSSGQKIRYRSFTVKEEKLLLIAQSSGEQEDYINAFKQLITNCCIDEIDVDKMASFDIEYFFINLRAKSVSNVVTLKIKDEHAKDIEVDIKLDEVQVHKPTVSNKIVLDPARDLGMKMKYPSFNEIQNVTKRDTTGVEFNEGLELFISLIDCIWEGEDVFPASESTRDELMAFVEDFSNEQVEKIEAFLSDLPYVYLDVNYMDSKGQKQTHRLMGIESFFAS